jgi:hypothetical protein
VLDRALRPVPVGVAGELYVAGDQLARGYLGRPDRTAERFLPDPFAHRPGERLYRTGDRVRWRADGSLELVGRMDRQVEVRGHRVEPGEIETTLEAQPGVRRAVVVTGRQDDGQLQLVGYVAGGPGPAELRRRLRRLLPEPMVPSVLVPVVELPVTTAGKVDLARLPEPGPAPDDLDAGHVAPVTPAEELVASIWTEVLGIERVGADDDFFELGGHSLLAIQVVSRLRARGGLEVPVRLAFERPRLAELAAALADLPRTSAPAIRARGHGR